MVALRRTSQHGRSLPDRDEHGLDQLHPAATTTETGNPVPRSTAWRTMNRLLVRSLLLYCSFIAVSLLTYAAGSEFLLALWPLHVGYSLQEAGLRTGTDVLTLQLAGLLVVAGVASFVQSRVGPSGSPAWVVAVVVVVVSLAGFSLGLFGLAYTFLH